MKNNPFSWVHSEFGFFSALILGTAMWLFAQDRTIAGYFEFLVGLNTLFWVKQFTNRKRDSAQTIALAQINGGGKTGDPLT